MNERSEITQGSTDPNSVTDLCEDCDERPITGLDARCDSCRENANERAYVIERLHFVKSQQNGYGELADDCIAEITRLREVFEEACNEVRMSHGVPCHCKYCHEPDKNT